MITDKYSAIYDDSNKLAAALRYMSKGVDPHKAYVLNESAVSMVGLYQRLKETERLLRSAELKLEKIKG